MDELLKLILTWGDNKSMTIGNLTKKLALLLALTSAGRVSEITGLKISHLKKLPNGYLFTLDKHKKNRKTSTLPGTLIFPL